MDDEPMVTIPVARAREMRDEIEALKAERDELLRAVAVLDEEDHRKMLELERLREALALLADPRCYEGTSTAAPVRPWDIAAYALHSPMTPERMARFCARCNKLRQVDEGYLCTECRTVLAEAAGGAGN